MADQQIKIILDTRELRNPIAKLLFEKNIKLEPKRLEVGDFILSDHVVVELKKVPDFVNSLLDGRLFTQAVELRRNFDKPLYIIEGVLEDIFEVRNVAPNAIRAALISLMLDYQIPILFSSQFEDTADILELIAKREQLDLKKEISLRGSKRIWSLSEQQQFLVEGLPLVGPSLAKALLKKFKTPKKIFNAKIDKLMKVAKVGEKKAESIRKLLDEKYESD